MNLTLVLTISVLLQATAAVLALRLIRITRTRLAWILIASAISLMTLRRLTTLVHTFSAAPTYRADFNSELIALATSLLMVIGIALIAPIFLSIKRSEEALRESEEKHRALVETMNDGLAIRDENGFLTYVNDRFCAMLGYSRDEIIGHPVTDFLDEANQDILGEQMAAGTKGGHPSYDITWTGKGGLKIPTIVSPAPIRDAEGQIKGSFGVITDITDRKKAEEALQQAMAELKRSNDELQQFASVASHDLQEPLRMISSYLQLIERRYKGKLDEDADEFIAFAVDGATRLQDMINGLLAYARVGTRGKPFEPIASEAVLEQALLNLQVAIEESGAAVTHDPLPTIVGDAAQLDRVFQNLISNAIKFHGEEPLHIHISAKLMGNEWVFSARDNGLGIDPQYQDRIFGIFQHLHAREEYPGIGIGLAICKRIVERHGGRIWVEAEAGGGSTFYFTIPIRRGER
ncbi:MAG: PAS domain S-box protein [Thermodesulfobacteriota bacterium]|nr:PAS domain S-box protein [Thermodesulfobacteriota bacterium]